MQKMNVYLNAMKCIDTKETQTKHGIQLEMTFNFWHLLLSLSFVKFLNIKNLTKPKIPFHK